MPEIDNSNDGLLRRSTVRPVSAKLATVSAAIAPTRHQMTIARV
jgi:hypothetical protein